MEKLVCVQDFEDEALRKLDRNAGDYFKSGADDEITLRRNLESYNRWLIRPRMLRDVSRRNLKKMVQGKLVQFPIGFSPVGFQGLANFDGEIPAAKAASSMGTIFVLSTYASKSIEEIGDACPNGRKWFQLFPNSQKCLSADLLRRAEKAGFEAIVVTLDAQNFGNKRRTARNGLIMPPYVRLGNLVKYVGDQGSSSESSSSSSLSLEDGNSQSPSSSTDEDVSDIAAHVHRNLAQDLTWDIISFVRRQTQLPVILKGILTPEDAAIAMKHRVAGIWISNHGGRQVDTAPQPIDVLPEISEVVKGQCEIYLDSGVRKGSDAFKALALGATMVFVGRPQVWGSAVAGEAGARKVLQILEEELDLTLALSGVADVENLKRDSVCRLSDLHAKL